ncbi:PHP domain-containing protein [Clostridium aceticum]|uniref:PHP domain-containing protein n=1 Tax=Clostridium aceticum TaxID=84022 RepID=A0A0G3WCC5_9CLOT|nr:PHP domain-containing protein [Clostridium aceticum]AKL95079.1 PHP domain-containing protein [Clostridium aceticum]
MVTVDLHIHSGLSPCADNDMTPNNIIRMAQLKGIEAVAITDHNCTKNLASFIKVGEDNNIICIPGVEITTKEEVHLTVLFQSLIEAEEFQTILDDTLPRVKNDTRLFGNQYIYDEKDNIVEEYSTLLINALSLPLKEAVSEIRKLKGIPIPAHIDRNSFSILSNLGFIDSELGFKVVEVTQNCNFSELKKLHPYLKNYKKIISSDAHDLGEILEGGFFLKTQDKSIQEIFKILKGEV